MSFKKPTRQYWDHKFAAYMHDPFDKAFRIQGHEERAAEIMRIFGLEKPNEKFWQKADGIASGFERGQVPTYSNEPHKNGAVDLVNDETAIITHPTGRDQKIKISIPNPNVDVIHAELKKFLKNNIGDAPEKGGYSNNFPNDHDGYTVGRFLYTHLALRFKLSEENVAGLGAFWHRLPADTRFPDHSIWQHNALTSALYSSMELAGDDENIGLLVFSITPVQSFISQARKLRDYWTGSVLLSWLAFEGLRWIIENLGPDHILYPSLVDQPLVNEYLKKKWHVKDVRSLSDVRNIASLPNKFVILIPFNHAESIAENIQNHIQKEWLNLTKLVTGLVIDQVQLRNPQEIDFLEKMIISQAESFWELQWSAAQLLGEDDIEEVAKLLPEIAYSQQSKLLNILNEIIRDKSHYQKSGKGTLYSVSHTLVQSALAAHKMKRKDHRKTQQGEKCSICGEFEALHSEAYKEGQSAKDYSEYIKEFWKRIATGKEIEFRKNEHLCAICYTKRMVYRIFKNQNAEGHILHTSFSDADKFPSTTEISLFDWFERHGIPKPERIRLADKLHNKEEGTETNHLDKKPLNNGDKYYAILVMDGDHMGKLINGSTIASNWETIMHPIIVKRLKNPEFDKIYRENWEKIFNEHKKRAVTPSIHAAISEALGDFSIYGVEPIIRKFNGRLIYAGGDDVCAVLPMKNAVTAAMKIRNYYISGFKYINADESIDIKEPWNPKPGKISVLMGKGEGLTISAGILICHHKESLTEMISQAQKLLKEKAKRETKRNALALQLKKRSGGSRFAVYKWENVYWDSFKELITEFGKTEDRELSRSLIYRLGKFTDGLSAILASSEPESNLRKFILSQIDKSGIAINKKQEISELISTVLIKPWENIVHKKKEQLSIDPLAIAAFLGKGEE